MIKALQIAYAKQKNNIPFGPKDIPGPMVALINRGLIRAADPALQHGSLVPWIVTQEAINLLKETRTKK